MPVAGTFNPVEYMSSRFLEKRYMKSDLLYKVIYDRIHRSRVQKEVMEAQDKESDRE